MDELSSLEGRLRHCVAYKGNGRCKRYAPGPGKPNARARKRAGITRKFYEKSTTRKKAARTWVCRKVKGQKKRSCGWRYLTAAQARSTRKRTYRKATGGRKGVYRASRKSRKVASTRRKHGANFYARRAESLEKKAAKARAMALKKAGGVGHGRVMGGLEGLRRRRSTRRRRTRR